MLHVISLGAGVQSSTMALMASHGEITPMPDCAIFADTQDEPQAVYDWLDWLEKQLPYPVHRVTKGRLSDEVVRIARSKKSGLRYMKGMIPAFVRNVDGSIGILGRKCTKEYKIAPITAMLRGMVNTPSSGERRAGFKLARHQHGRSAPDEAAPSGVGQKPLAAD